MWLVGCGGEASKATKTWDPSEPWQQIDPALANRFQAALENARAEQNLPGLAMAVAYRDSRELWVSATGMADVDEQTPWQASNESRIGSVTKTFTAALVLRLEEEGMLSLDDPIEAWVPGWYSGPTLTQLLNHTSGIASYNYTDTPFDESASWTPQELVGWAYEQEPELHFTPGTQWEYSNTNYALLGLVVEAVTGESYRAALDRWLLEPTGLDRPRLARSGDDSATLVRCYEGIPAVNITSTIDPSFGWAAGGLVSTPEDLASWTVALYGGGVLAPDTLTLMTASSGVVTDDFEDYGLGTIIEDGSGDDSEYTTLGHTGGIGGYTTFAFYLQELDVALIMMSNWRETDLRAASMHGWAAILNVPYP